MDKITVHMIGNAHIDPAWLWRWPDGFAEVKATFRSALDRMDEYPDFVFTCGCSLYYQWVEHNAPELFEEIRRRVEQGRWVIVGGWLIQPDCNTPSGESFVRQSLYGQRYFLSRFGRCASVGYNVDSFGHNAMLPQILKKSGMDSYVMMRPQDFEMRLPASTFWWESPDGSRVRTFRIPVAYASYWGDPDPLWDKQRRTLECAGHDGSPCTMNFYGVGNHGGGPTRRNIETVRSMQAEGEADVVFSSPDAFFRQMEECGVALPVVSGELQHHSSGCYSAHLRTKQLNRQAEQALLHAETLSAMQALLLGDGPDDRARLRDAWEKVLFNQFHDVMGGCSIPAVYDDAQDFYGYAKTVAAQTANHAFQRIAWNIDTSGGETLPLSRDLDWLTWEREGPGVPVVVFNTHSWEVTAPVTLDARMAGVTDENGEPVPVQIVRSPRSDLANIWDTVFLATVPPMGYRVYRAYRSRAFVAEGPSVRADAAAGVLENDLVRVSFDPQTGAVCEWLDKRTGEALFDGPAAQAVQLDESHIDTWGHSRNYWDRVCGAFDRAEVRVLESGPVRACVRVVSRCGRSELQQDFRLYAGSAAVEVEGRVYWRERHKMLKLQFPLRAQCARSFYQIPYGVIERPANGEEESCQQWADVCGTRRDGTGVGVAVLNTGNQSASVRGNRLGFTVLRSPIYAENAGLYMENEGVHEADCPCMEQGETLFGYTIFPHGFDGTSAHAAQLTRAAAERNRPFTVVKETYHKGPLGLRYSGLSVEGGTVVAGAFKRAEDGAGWILRLSETAGAPCTARVSCPMLGRTLDLAFGPQEIKTVFLPDNADEPAVETDLLERPLTAKGG